MYKICLITLQYPPDHGGVGQSVRRISTFLDEIGYEVHVAVIPPGFRREYEMANAGEYRRGYIRESRDGSVTVHRFYPTVRSAQASQADYKSELFLQLSRLHRKHNFDLLHAFFVSTTGFLTTLLAQETDTPVINSIRGADLHRDIFNPDILKYIVWTLRNSDWNTFVSRDMMNRATTLVPEIQDKSSVFWNSISPSALDDLPLPDLPREPTGIVIGSLGKFRRKKGIEYLVDACSSLPSEIDYTLLLVGDHVDTDQGFWEKIVEESGIRDRIIVTGTLPREEALALLERIDIFAIPSIDDGCPNALLEAMLAGKAIVGTRVDAIGEIIEHNRDGLLVPPADSGALGSALQRLVDDPGKRAQLGANAQKKVLTLLTLEKELQNWQSVYFRVLNVEVSRV